MINRKKDISKIDLKVIVIIISASIVLGFIYNSFSAYGIPLIREPIKVNEVGSLSQSVNENELRGLDLANTIALYNQGNALFIDARDQWEYGEGHIKGAINIPEFSFTVDNTEIEELDKDNLLVIYCSGDECETSKRLADQLSKLGFKNTFVFLGGYNMWAEADLPVQKEVNNE